MNTTAKIHQAKLSKWAALIKDQSESNLTVKEWCDQNHFSIHRYHYWKRLLKEEAIEQVLPEIVPLTMPSVQPNEPLAIPTATVGSETCASCATFTSNLCARLYINGICIELDSSANETFIKNIIKAVRHA